MKTMGTRSLSSAIALVLDICWYGMGLFLGLAVCFLMVTPWVDPPRVEIGLAMPVSFSVNADTSVLPGVTPGAAHVHLENGNGKLFFSPRSRAMAAEGTAGLIVVLVFGMWVVGNLRQVFRTLRAGKAFAPENASRIRRVGWAFVAAEFARMAFSYAGGLYASQHFATDGVVYDARFLFSPFGVVCGLIIVVLAEVFREGTRLDDDQSLTV